MDLELIVRKVNALTKEVSIFIQSSIGKVSAGDIVTKDLNSLVTYVDRRAEEMIVAGLNKILPEAGFITEEETVDQSSGLGYNWIIDPLDGTTNYLHRLPFYAISIALRRNDEYLLGVVYEIDRQNVFYAWQGGGAWENNHPIKVSQTAKLSDSLLATGFPYAQFDMVNKYLNLFRDLFATTRGIRRIGSAALDLVYLANGSFDAFFEYGLNEWDIAAGICIVREAGGEVTAFDGSSDMVKQRTILASNALLHNDMKAHISRHF